METKHLTYFKVENFKRFDSLEVNDIGQFNLIVGDNNVGKTTLLEALLFDDEDYNQFLRNIANALEYNRKIILPEDRISYLDFYSKNKNRPISLSYKYLDAHNQLLINKGVLNDLSEKDLRQLGAWTFNTINATKNLIKFEFNGKVEYKLALKQFLLEAAGYFPFIGFNSNSKYDIFNFSKISVSTAKLGSLQTQLKYFIPNLVAIEINNAIIPETPTIAIRESNMDLQPLSQYGDGVVKLFKYLLELEFRENKRLMIDEIDIGIHYSRMKEFLKMVIQSAKNKNVQIFATTHSKECIEYYKQALEETGLQDCGKVIRIADTRSGIKAYTLNFKQLENSLFAESEIR